MHFITDNNSSFATRMLIRYDGKVGIGTTSPNKSLTVVGGNIAMVGGGSQGNFYMPLSTGNGDGGFMFSSDPNNTVQNYGTGVVGSMFFKSGDGFHVSATGAYSLNDFAIKTSGLIGIGTNAPGKRLTVVADDSTAGNWQAREAVVRIQNIDDAAADSRFAGCQFAFSPGHDSSADNYVVGTIGAVLTDTSTQWAGDLVFGVKAATSSTTISEAMRIQTGGNVGIGTAAPGALLHCIGGAGGVNIAKFERTSGASGHVAINVNGADPQIVFDEGTVEWAVGVKDTDNSFRIADNSTIGTNDVFTLDTSGNCGIGTTSPAHLLEVESTTAWQGSAQINQKSDGIEGAQLFLKHTSASPADNDYLAFLHFKGMNSAAQEVQYARIHATSADVTDGTEDGSLFFNTAVGGTANTNVMSLVGGKVGIGTTSPAAKLQANGEIRIVSSASYNTHLNYLDTGTNFITTTNSGTTSFRGSNNNITTMTVKGDGKVSINKAINTAVSLSVNAPASNTTNYGLEICNASSNTRFIVDGVGNTSFYGSDNSLSARVTSDGKVGIGTTVPGSYKLYVNGNTWVQGSLETSGQLKAGTSLAIGSSGSGGYTLPATDGTNGYVLKTNGSGTVTWQADSSGGGGGSGDITSVIGGNAIDVSGGSSGDATVNHADTSTQASVNNSGYLVVQDITLDAYGHVTGINSKTVGDTTGFALTSYGTCGVRLTWTEAGTSETDTAYPTGCGGGGGS